MKPGNVEAGRRPQSASPTHVAIIGGGRGGKSLVEIFQDNPLVRIIGLADTNPRSPGARLAGRLKIPVARDYRKLLKAPRLDLVIDVTGNPEVEKALLAFNRSGVAVIGGASAKFMWQLIEEKIRSSREVERHLREYQELYRLYVKEVGVAISEERMRIACDIHDGLVQTLAGLNFKLDYCRESLISDPEEARRGLSEVRELLKEAIGEARRVIFNLRPLSFDRPQLIPALKNYLKTYGEQVRIETDFRAEGNERRLNRKTKIFIFRIIQEALSNIQKHAAAKNVRVRLNISDTRFSATIADDGVGFDANVVLKNPEDLPSFGLKGILDRTKLLGGVCRVKTGMGEGTRITIHIPIDEGEKTGEKD